MAPKIVKVDPIFLALFCKSCTPWRQALFGKSCTLPAGPKVHPMHINQIALWNDQVLRLRNSY